MLHIIKWQTQPERRSLSWIAGIEDARDEITDIREETPNLTETVLQELWTGAFIVAKRDAEAEMGKRTEIDTLTQAEVFEMVYSLDR